MAVVPSSAFTILVGRSEVYSLRSTNLSLTSVTLRVECTGDSGVLYFGLRSDGIPWADPQELKDGSPGDWFGALANITQGTNYISATGLTPNTYYYAGCTLDYGGQLSDVAQHAFRTLDQPGSNVDIDGLSETGFILRMTGDHNPGKVYAAVRTSGAYLPGDYDLIKDGTGAAWSGSVDNGYTVALLVDGLTPGTTYYYGSFVELDWGDQFPIVSGSVTTLALQPPATLGKFPNWRPM